MSHSTNVISIIIEASAYEQVRGYGTVATTKYDSCTVVELHKWLKMHSKTGQNMVGSSEISTWDMVS